MVKNNYNFDNEECLTKYFKDVRKSNILTVDEELALAIRISEGDERAIDTLVNANLKFVVSIAKDYQNQGLSLSDLISEGNYGLVKAAKKFDHTKGFRFISYAVWWIRQSIISSLCENARMVRLPTNVINKLATLRKRIEKFEFENEREPIYGELVDENDEAIDLNLYPKCSSLNEIINDDGDELIDMITSEYEEPTQFNPKIKNELNDTLLVLTDRERDIVESYYGVNRDSEPMTLEAIGEKYGLTKERVRQLKVRSLRKLRHNAHNLYVLMNE